MVVLISRCRVVPFMLAGTFLSVAVDASAGNSVGILVLYGTGCRADGGGGGDDVTDVLGFGINAKEGVETLPSLGVIECSLIVLGALPFPCGLGFLLVVS